ncbi:MAG: hypothetical protein GXO56_02880 [Chloroflexi bacterium]|nr:hypothetical protein [Chloroflexota bacterium]
MPQLVFSGKQIPPLEPASLRLESVVWPPGQSPSDALPPNRLLWGDNLAIMSALLPQYEGKIRLIYADPPFFTNRRYRARVGRGEDSRKPETWRLAEGYADRWASLDDYLAFLYPRLVLMHRLLAPNGTFYLHLDWHAAPYARVLLDEIFGPKRLINEIVWVYHGPSPIKRAFNRKHDTILMYAKGDDYMFNVDAVRVPYNPNTVATFRSSPKAGFGKVPDLARGKVPEDWWYFPVVARLHRERTGYPTQKPEALLERIVLASSQEGDWVADFFCGAGTTAVVANRLGRRFLCADATQQAIQTSRLRLMRGQAAFAVEADQQLYRPPQPFPAEWTPAVEDGWVSLPQAALAQAEGWEVGYWTDGVFYSTAQAVRAPRATEPPPARLPWKEKNRTLAVRLTALDGAVWLWQG